MLLSDLDLPPDIVPYQVRHGAASEAAFSKTLDILEIQERLRHSAPSSTRRYEKHARYAVELHKVPKLLTTYGNTFWDRRANVLRGVLRPPPLSEFHRSTEPAKLTTRYSSGRTSRVLAARRWRLTST